MPHVQFASQSAARGFPSLWLQVLQLRCEPGPAQAALLPACSLPAQTHPLDGLEMPQNSREASSLTCITPTRPQQR